MPGSQLEPGPVQSVCWVAEAPVSNEVAIAIEKMSKITRLMADEVPKNTKRQQTYIHLSKVSQKW